MTKLEVKLTTPCGEKHINWKYNDVYELLRDISCPSKYREEIEKSFIDKNNYSLDIPKYKLELIYK